MEDMDFTRKFSLGAQQRAVFLREKVMKDFYRAHPQFSQCGLNYL